MSYLDLLPKQLEIQHGVVGTTTFVILLLHNVVYTLKFIVQFPLHIDIMQI